MAALAEQLHPLKHSLPIAEQIGDEDHQPAPREGFRERLEHRQKGCGPPLARLSPHRFEHLDNARQLRALRARRHRRAHLAVKYGAAGSITVRQRQPSEARRQSGGIFILRQAARLVVHARRGIDHQRQPQAGFLLKFLDVQPVLPGPHFPVDAAQIIPADILPVLEKFDRLPLVGALVQAGEHPLHDSPGTQLKPRDAGNRLRMQISFGSGRHASAHPLWWEWFR